MKYQSVEWFIERFEQDDVSIQAALLISVKDQHKNCRLAFEQYCKTNTDRVEKIFNKVKEAVE